MRRIVLLLMILSLTRIAAVYADPNQVNTNVFTGNQVEATTDDGTFSGLFQGVDLAIWKGDAGPAGAQGVAGADGAQGAQGADGAQGVAGVAGADGAQGAAGTNGSDGAQGPAGTNGSDGAQGAAGPSGSSGAQGPAGADGAQGAAGPAGSSGSQGAAGVKGAQGTAGVNGASVVVTTLSTGDANCSKGGSKFTAGDGTVAYACNGSGGGDGAINGTGTIEVGTCDDSVVFGFVSKFTGSEFVLNKVTFDSFSTNCASRNVAIFFTMTTRVVDKYEINDEVQCTYTLPAASGWSNATGADITISSSDVQCKNLTHAYTFTNGFNSLPTRHLGPTIGVEIT